MNHGVLVNLFHHLLTTTEEKTLGWLQTLYGDGMKATSI